MPNIHDYLKQQALKKAEKEKQQAGKEKKKFPKIRPYTILSPESQGFKENRNNDVIVSEIVETPKLELKKDTPLDLKPKITEELVKDPIIQKEGPVQVFNSNKKESSITRIEQDAARNHYEAVHDKLDKGYTKFPNNLFKIMAKRELTSREMSVLFVIVRLTLGFQKLEAQISNSVFRDFAGLDQSSVIIAATKSLEEKGLIKKVPSKNGSTNVFRILIDSELENLIFSSTKKEIEKGGAEFSVDEIKNKIIGDYFSGLTEKKKAKEIEDYKDLKSLYSEEELSRALNVILTDSKYKEVHSPFAYLCYSIDSVLQTPLKSDASISQEVIAKQEQERLLKEKTEEEKRQNLQGLFEELPEDEKEKYLTIARRKFNLTKGGSLEKKMAINEWSKNQPVFQEAQA